MVNKFFKNIFSLLILLLLTSFGFAKEGEISSSKALADGIDVISDVEVYSDDFTAGAFGNYIITFDITKYAHSDLKNGFVIITFPDNFDLSQIDTVNFIDNSELINYYVLKTEINGSSLNIHIRESKNNRQISQSEIPDNDFEVEVEITINHVGNPSEAADYQLSLVAVKKNNTILYNPAISEKFTIIPDSLYEIIVMPADDLFFTAGDIRQFSAYGVDRFGNKISGLEFDWMLVDCDPCPGYFEYSTLFVTTVGHGYAQATYENMSGRSGLITVTPGELDQLVLEIDPTQYVGHPLVTQATIALYDGFGNLKTDYNLADNPIMLTSDEGQLNPDVLSDESYFTDGVIDLVQTGIVYEGLSATTNIVAYTNTISSNMATVSFNGYDILSVLNIEGNPLNAIIANNQTTAFVSIINRGNRMPDGYHYLNAYYQSQTDTAEGMYLPYEAGVEDTLGLILPIHNGNVSSDLLTFKLVSTFNIEGVYIDFIDTISVEVEILPSTELNLISESFDPDTVLVGLPFKMSFEIETSNLISPLDSAVMEISVIYGNSVGETIFVGSPQYYSYENNIISYKGLSAELTPDLSNQKGLEITNLTVDYRLYSQGNLFTLSNNSLPLAVYNSTGINLVVNSLMPDTVYAGQEVDFDFTIENILLFPIELATNSSGFRLYDDNFSTTSAIVLIPAQIEPGVNQLKTGSIYIPENLAGAELLAEYSLGIRLPGIFDIIFEKAMFDQSSLPVHVVESPPAATVRILDIELLAPNSPRVNVNQQFQIKTTIANLSQYPIDELKVALITTGPFDYQPFQSIYNITPYDTVTAVFDIVALDITEIADHFHLDISSSDVIQLPPDNNIALVVVEEPANLEITSNLFGIDNNIADHGEQVTLNISMVNTGTAEVTPAGYRIVLSGLDFNGSDTILGTMEAGSSFNFDFTTPDYDTAITIDFLITDPPVDRNNLSQAPIDNPELNIIINVLSSEASLTAESNIIGSNLILPKREKEIFELILSNTGASDITDVKLQKIEMTFSKSDGSPLKARDIVDINKTGFYENGINLTDVVSGGDMVVFYFDDYIISHNASKTLKLITEFKMFNQDYINLKITTEGVDAVFINEPNTGMPIPVSSLGNDYILLYQMALKSASLEGSFIISENPFNPLSSTVEFTYELSKSSSVEFRVFTLTGEEVYARDIPMGEEGTNQGENFIGWDGRNNKGDMVMNGVYIALIKNTSTGEDARLKVVVIK